MSDMTAIVVVLSLMGYAAGFGMAYGTLDVLSERHPALDKWYWMVIVSLAWIISIPLAVGFLFASVWWERLRHWILLRDETRKNGDILIGSDPRILNDEMYARLLAIVGAYEREKRYNDEAE